MPSMRVLGGHTDRIFHCKFAPQRVQNMNMLATASQDGSACVWEVIKVPAARVAGRGESGKEEFEHKVASSPDHFSSQGESTWYKGAWLREQEGGRGGAGKGGHGQRHREDHPRTIFCDDGSVYRIRWVSRLHGHHDECLRLSWGVGVASPFLATAGASGNVILWDLKSSQQVGVFYQGEKHQVYVCQFFPEDGSALLTGHEDLLSMWDVERGLVVGRWQFQPRLSVQSVPAGGTPGRNDGDVCFVYGAGTCARTCTVAAGLSDGSVRIVDPRTGGTVQSFQAHRGTFVSNVSYSAHDSNRLASAGGDGTVKLWDVRQNRENEGCERESATFAGHRGASYGAAFVRQRKGGNGLFSWGADGAVRTWNTSSSSGGAGSEYFSNGNLTPKLPNRDYPALWFDANEEGSLGAVCGGSSGGNQLHHFHLVHLSR
jgi:WD40 repeat protein|eukprot:g4713.t1